MHAGQGAMRMTAPEVSGWPAGPPVSSVDAVKEKARRLRILSMVSTRAAGSGHPTSCLSAAEPVARAFFYAMKFNLRNPQSVDSDRFALYSLFHFPCSVFLEE